MGSCSEKQAILYHHKVNALKPEQWRGSAFGFFYLTESKGTFKKMNSNRRFVEGLKDFPVSDMPNLNLLKKKEKSLSD